MPLLDVFISLDVYVYVKNACRGWKGGVRGLKGGLRGGVSPLPPNSPPFHPLSEGNLPHGCAVCNFASLFYLDWWIRMLDSAGVAPPGDREVEIGLWLVGLVPEMGGRGGGRGHCPHCYIEPVKSIGFNSSLHSSWIGLDSIGLSITFWSGWIGLSIRLDWLECLIGWELDWIGSAWALHFDQIGLDRVSDWIGLNNTVGLG